jgi:hypothetical protein
MPQSSDPFFIQSQMHDDEIGSGHADQGSISEAVWRVRFDSQLVADKVILLSPLFKVWLGAPS